MELGPERESYREQAGLCADCRNSRKMTSDRGAVFWFCELSKVDARFVKYPRLPVQACTGYQQAADSPRWDVGGAARATQD